MRWLPLSSDLWCLVRSVGVVGGNAEILLARGTGKGDKKQYALKRMHVHKDDVEKNKIAQWEFMVQVGRGKTRSSGPLHCTLEPSWSHLTSRRKRPPLTDCCLCWLLLFFSVLFFLLATVTKTSQPGRL